MVVAYREKPEHRVLVSSGVFVLGPSAVKHLPPNQRKEVSWLVNHLLTEQAKVTAFLHDAPWIDVNDAHAISRAEQLLASNPAAFEYRAALPDHPA
jgi:NDP-sugar pyrophosphorylase family protein